MSSLADAPTVLETPPNLGIEETLLQAEAERERATQLSTLATHPPGKVPGFRIQRCLGEGAYGSVWLGIEQNTGKQVAIKFYSHRRGLDWSLLNREVEKLAVLYTSRQVVRLIDVGWNADPPYYVMEFLENGSLAKLLEQGPLPCDRALEMVCAVGHALVHAHGSGILHCDLKPANVLLDREFQPRLADFGQSRLSHEQHPALGTLFYMAPEQASLEAIPDARWDVYALGALLYQTLTGQIPYRTAEAEERILQTVALEDRLQVYRDVLQHGTRPTAHRVVPGVDRALGDIIDQCLEIDPQRRFPNAQAVLTALDERTRQRAVRPLLMLGLLAPLLLLLAMLPLGQGAMSVAVSSASANLTSRALESDAVAVRILANSIDRDLQSRMLEMEQLAADPEFRAALHKDRGVPWKDRHTLRKFLDGKMKVAVRNQQQQGGSVDISWLLNDASGLQLYRGPYNQHTVDKNFAWRDYFHGQGKDFTPETVPAGISPLHFSHISRAFRSSATQQFMVAVSVPVWDAEGANVIGVMARTINLGNLLSTYKPKLGAEAGGEIERTIALVDSRDFELLDHPWMTPEHLRDLPKETFHELRVDDRAQQLIRPLQLAAERGANELKDKFDRDTAYVDPVGRIDPENYGGEWLAAFWPVGSTSWTAIVQERKSVALNPVDEMQQTLFRYGRLGIAVCFVLIALVWYFIYKSLDGRRLLLPPLKQT